MSSFDSIAKSLEQIAKNQESFDPASIIVPLCSVLIGALFGAIMFHSFAKKRWKDEQLQIRTQSFIDLFYSKEFIFHRSSLYAMRERVVSNQLPIREVAAGFVYPIAEKAYDTCEGDNRFEGLNEHQHLTMYMGLLERMAYDINRGHVNIDSLKSALGYEFIWHADFLWEISRTARNIATEKRENIPSFCSSTEIVLNALGHPEISLTYSVDVLEQAEDDKEHNKTV